MAFLFKLLISDMESNQAYGRPLPLLNRPRPYFNKAEDEIPKPNLTKENHTFEDPDGMVTNSPLTSIGPGYPLNTSLEEEDWKTMVSMNPFIVYTQGLSIHDGVKEVPLKISLVHVYLLICLFFLRACSVTLS